MGDRRRHSQISNRKLVVRNLNISHIMGGRRYYQCREVSATLHQSANTPVPLSQSQTDTTGHLTLKRVRTADRLPFLSQPLLCCCELSPKLTVTRTKQNHPCIFKTLIKKGSIPPTACVFGAPRVIIINAFK